MKRRAFFKFLGVGVAVAATAKYAKKAVEYGTIKLQEYGFIKQGDIFTVADVYAVNPTTGKKEPFLKQFVVTSDNGNGNYSISPTMKMSGKPEFMGEINV